MKNILEPAASQLKIEYIRPACLKADPRNPRGHKPPQIAAIARSIQTFGFNVPVVTDSDDQILAGHGRVAAAIKLGLEAIPVVCISHLSPEQRQAFAIADNRLTDTSQWDERLLGEVLRDLSLADLDFELDAIGFSVGEIDLKIEAATSVPNEADDDDSPVELVDGPSFTSPGGLWQLGRHRLLCGDALDPHAWDELMDDRKADMVFADPPYNLPVDGFISGLGKVRHREFAAGAGEMDRDEFTAFLTDAFRKMAAHMQPGALAYLFMDHRHLVEMMTAGEAAFSRFKTLCAWAKPSGGMGGLYRNRMELVFGLAGRTRPCPRQRGPGQIRPQPHQCLGISRDRQLPLQRGQRSAGDAPHLQAREARERRDPRRHCPRRHRRRSVPGLRDDDYPNLLRRDPAMLP